MRSWEKICRSGGGGNIYLPGTENAPKELGASFFEGTRLWRVLKGHQTEQHYLSGPRKISDPIALDGSCDCDFERHKEVARVHGILLRPCITKPPIRVAIERREKGHEKSQSWAPEQN